MRQITLPAINRLVSDGKARYSLLSVLILFALFSVGLAWWSYERIYVAEIRLTLTPKGNQHLLATRNRRVLRLWESRNCLDVLLSPDVLEHALATSQIASLTSVVDEDQPHVWLRSKLMHTADGNGGEYLLRMEGPRHLMDEYCQIIDAIVLAYQCKVGDREDVLASERRKTVEARQTVLFERLDKLHSQYLQLVAESDSADPNQEIQLAQLVEEIQSTDEAAKVLELRVRSWVLDQASFRQQFAGHIRVGHKATVRPKQSR